MGVARIITLAFAIFFLALGASVTYCHEGIRANSDPKFLHDSPSVVYVLDHPEPFGWGGMIAGVLMIGLIMYSMERSRNLLATILFMPLGVYLLHYYPLHGPYYSTKDLVGWISVGFGTIFCIFFLWPKLPKMMKRSAVRHIPAAGPILRLVYLIPEPPRAPEEIYDAEFTEIPPAKQLPPHNPGGKDLPVPPKSSGRLPPHKG